MSAAPVTPPPASPASTPSWKGAAVIAGIQVVLALIGVALATANPRLARNYWMSLVPVYGLLCTWLAWKRSQESGERQVLRQVLHWLGIAGAVALDYLIRTTGFEAQSAAGLNALLLLAVGCYLAGVHLAWPFFGVAALLTGTLVVVAKADQYLWLVLVAAVAAAAAGFAMRRAFARGSRDGDPLARLP